MKPSLAFLLCGAAFAVGVVSGSIAVRSKPHPPPESRTYTDPALHAFEVYRPGEPVIAETLVVLEPGAEPRGDRPVWTVRYSSEKGVATYRCQSVSSK